MSTFIMESDNLNGSDLELAQQLDKTDMIYFYSKTGLISIDLHELLTTLKAKYTFYEIPEEEIDIESYCIMIGLLANTVSDTLILVYPEDSPIHKLDEREFPGPKGLFKIKVCTDFKTAIKLSKSYKGKRENQKGIRKSRVVKSKTTETDEKYTSYEDSKTDDLFRFKPTCDEFKRKLAQCEDGITSLVDRADAIADAIRSADEADLTLPMQLRIKCQAVDAPQICDLIRDNYQELKELACL